MDEKALLEIYGKRIKELREAKGLTQEALGFALDMEKSSINRLEKGRKNSKLFTLHRMAQALGVTLPELVDFPPTTKSKKK